MLRRSVLHEQVRVSSAPLCDDSLRYVVVSRTTSSAAGTLRTIGFNSELTCVLKYRQIYEAVNAALAADTADAVLL